MNLQWLPVGFAMGKQLLATTGCALVLMLSACGGGGGGGGGPQPIPGAPVAPTPPDSHTDSHTDSDPHTHSYPPVVNYNTSEYQRSNAATSAGAITAYNAGSTGKGVKLAVIDSGINPALVGVRRPDRPGEP